jgi:RNA polymerase sigma-70 factor (ECF subfamily)
MSTANVSDVMPRSWDQDAAAVEQEFERLFREHYQTVYRTAYGVLGNGSDAEDVAQTVFLRVLHAMPSRQLSKNPAGYLYRAAVNESLNAIRARRRQVLTADPERYEAVAIANPAVEPAEELHRRLYEAIAGLRQADAEVVILRYVHDRSDREIAQLLGTSRGTIAVRLYRTRARLRKLMRAPGSGEKP